ncbi:hypothetical protein BY998_101365 [Methylobacterium sp. B4]|nr:hypothetical protein BY998_101365 [Methylobacterium sp. B4]
MIRSPSTALTPVRDRVVGYTICVMIALEALMLLASLIWL